MIENLIKKKKHISKSLCFSLSFLFDIVFYVKKKYFPNFKPPIFTIDLDDKTLDRSKKKFLSKYVRSF